MMGQKLKNAMLIFLGCLALLLAVIGLALPVWPTTPFVLVAVGCFSCAPRLRRRVLRVRVLREYYESYHNGAALPRPTVGKSLMFLWLMLIVSGAIAHKLWIILLLAAVGAAVTVHILVLSRPRPRNRTQPQQDSI